MYDSLQWFVDRKLEKELIWKTINSTYENNDKRILEFVAIAGSGKTCLLKKIYRDSKKLTGAIPIYIDFEDMNYQRPELFLLLEQVGKSISEDYNISNLSIFNNKAKKLHESYQQYMLLFVDGVSFGRDSIQKIEDDITNLFNDTIKTILKSNKLILFLDSTEKAINTTLNEFQNKFIRMHIDNSNFFIIAAGQEPLEWEYNVKDKVDIFHLEGFDEHGIINLIECCCKLKGLSIDDTLYLASLIGDATKKHPMAIYLMLNYFSDDFSIDFSIETIEERREGSLNHLINCFIKNRLLNNVDPSGEYPNLSDILYYLSPYRAFQYEDFYFIVNKYLSDHFKDKNFPFFFKLLSDLENRTHIFFKDPSDHRILNPIVRNIYSNKMYLNRDQYCEIHNSIFKRYDLNLEGNNGIEQVRNIIESLYHLAVINNCVDERSDDIVAERLNIYLNKYFSLKHRQEKARIFNHLKILKNRISADEEFLSLLHEPYILIEKIVEYQSNHV